MFGLTTLKGVSSSVLPTTWNSIRHTKTIVAHHWLLFTSSWKLLCLLDTNIVHVLGQSMIACHTNVQCHTTSATTHPGFYHHNHSISLAFASHQIILLADMGTCTYCIRRCWDKPIYSKTKKYTLKGWFNSKNYIQTSTENYRRDSFTCLCLPGRSISGASLQERILPNASNTLQTQCASICQHQYNSIFTVLSIICILNLCSTVIQVSKHPMGLGYKAQLAWKCLFVPTFFSGRFRPSFGVQWEFTSRSGYARLQVSVCSGYNLCHPH